TATGGHPIPLAEDVLLPAGYFPGYTKETLKDYYYFILDSELDLQNKWPRIFSLRPDFIKTFLLFSDQFAQRSGNPAYVGQKGLDPRLLQQIVTKAHANHLRMWSETTPGTIFPKRQIGALREGFEASFLALEADPVKDFRNVRRIKVRFKQGFLLEP